MRWNTGDVGLNVFISTRPSSAGRRQRIVPAETEGRVDQGHVREGLREVADHPSGERVVFLREQTELVAQREQALEQFDRVLLAADHVEAVDEPERTGQERPLPPREPVDRSVVIGAVAQHEAVIDQIVFDGFDGRDHPLVGRGQEAQRGGS